MKGTHALIVALALFSAGCRPRVVSDSRRLSLEKMCGSIILAGIRDNREFVGVVGDRATLVSSQLLLMRDAVGHLSYDDKRTFAFLVVTSSDIGPSGMSALIEILGADCLQVGRDLAGVPDRLLREGLRMSEFSVHRYSTFVAACLQKKPDDRREPTRSQQAR